MRFCVPIFAVYLSGCASILTPDYTLHARPIILKQAIYGADKIYCRDVAEGNRPGVSLGRAATAGLQGLGDTASSGLLNPFIPVVGAAGSAFSSVNSDIGLSPAIKRATFLKCMDKETEADGSARIYDTQ